MRPCHGICRQYAESGRINGRLYPGRKRCGSCEVYLKWDGKFCPCCSTPMRSKPRSKKFRELQEVARI